MAEMIEEISSPESSDDTGSIKVFEWEQIPKTKKKENDEWTEAKSEGKKYKPGKAGKTVTTVRELKPRPCHTYVSLLQIRQVQLRWMFAGITLALGAASRAMTATMPIIIVSFSLGVVMSKLTPMSLAELTESQREELARLAKEIICPYIKNNRCTLCAMMLVILI